MALDVKALLKISGAELDELFKKSPAGEIPDGQAKGTAIIASGTVFGPEIAEFINLFVWEGKTFDGEPRRLDESALRLRPEGDRRRGLQGRELARSSRVHGVLDYSKTSLVAHWIRNEIRWNRAELLSRAGLLGLGAAHPLLAAVRPLNGSPGVPDRSGRLS